MKEILTLLTPRFLSFKNRGLSGNLKGRKLRFLFFGTIGLLFWGGTFFVFYRVLAYFQRLEELGDILAYKLLSMALITFFSLLIFSGILTSLSKLYLSRDLFLVHSMPVSREKIFLGRWIESTMDSSWMVLIYSLPFFLPYGLVYKAGGFYYAMLGGNLLPFCLIASSLSALLVMLVAVCLPAGRIRTVFIFLGLFLFLVLLFSFRLIRPERFARPESFMTVMAYLQTLESSHSPFLPTTWFFDSTRGALTGKIGSAFFHSALSWSCAIAMVFVSTWVSGAVYFKGLSKAQIVPQRFFSRSHPRRWGHGWFLDRFSGPVRALAVKEAKTFFRDQTQWSQVFLIAALIVIYLYNFSVLPIEGGPTRIKYLQNVLSFLNMGLAAFVLSAVAARFVFPAVSLEGDAFWIVKCSPVSIRTFLWIKFFIYWLPLLFLAELLIIVTNVLLQVTPFMMVVSIVTIFLVVPGIISMGIGIGAMYPDFQSENPAQAVTSLGGLIYMTLCIGFIASVIILEAGPVYTIIMTGIRGGRLRSLQWFWLMGSCLVVFSLCWVAVVIPIRMGEKRISHYELTHHHRR